MEPMGLRCLFGHDFGEPTAEREREVSGEEVVITVREVETCRRCGKQQLVSQNKEVTALDRVAGSADGGDRPAAPPPADGGGSDASAVRRAADDATDPGENASADGTAAGGGVGSPAGSGEPAVSPTDDGVVLPDDAPDDDGSEGWPSFDDGEAADAAEPAPWPDPAPADDGEASDDDGDRPDWPDPAPGRTADGTAEAGDVDETDAEIMDGSSEGTQSGTDDVEPEPDSLASASLVNRPPDPDDSPTGIDTDVTLSTVDDDPPAEFYCSECGHAAPAGDAPIRGGDVCPRCGGGYIKERSG